MADARHRAALPLRAVLALFALVWFVPHPVVAQDDWSLSRDERPRPRERGRRPRAGGDLRTRYLSIALADPRDGFAMDRLLELWRASGTLDDLVSALAAERARDPSQQAAVDLVLARVARERGDTDEARRLYASITAGPLAWLAALGLFRIEQGGTPAAARSALERALSLAPAREEDELQRLLGELYLDLGDFDAAERMYRTLGAGARSVHLRTELARALSARGEHERALAAYRAVADGVAADRRTLAPLLVEVAREELHLARLDDAVTTLERARAVAGRGAGVRGEVAELLLDAHRRRGTLGALAVGWERSRVPEEILGRARALDELGRDDEAVLAYRQAIRSRGRDVDARLGEIHVLLRSARLDEAIASYRELIRVGRRPQHVIALAELLQANGRPDEALTTIDTLVRTARPEDGASLEAVARLLSGWGDGARAIRALERRAALSPDDPVALVALGDQLLADGQTDLAFAAFRRLLDVSPDRAEGHAALGAVLFDHDRTDEAIVELRTAIRLRGERSMPVELDTLRLLALAEERAGHGTAAETAWQDVLRAAAGDPPIAREAREHVVSGWARARVLDRHVGELRVSFESAPPDVEAGRFLVEALRRRGDVDGAVAALRRLDELAPGDVPSLELLERLEIQRGDYTGAIDALMRLTRVEPRRAAERYRRMASHALALYRDEDALGYVRRAVELAPDDAESWVELGELLATRSDAEGARAALRRAVELDPRRYELALSLAAQESAMGAWSSAADLLVRVAQSCPDDALVAQAVRRLSDLSAASGNEGMLAALESALLGQVLRAPERVALRRIYLDLVSSRAEPLALRSDAESRAALSLIVTRGLAPILLAVGSADPAEASRAIHLVSLARPTGAASTLLGRAEREGDARARLDALTAFAPLARAEHAPRLTALAHTGDVALRRLAVWALARALSGEARERALLPIVLDPDREVAAMAALSLSGDTTTALGAAARDALSRRLGEGTDAAPVFAWALSRSMPREVVARLTAGSASPTAFLALARTEDADAARLLAQALLVPTTRAAAARAFGAARTLTGDVHPLPDETSAAFLERALPSRPVDVELLSGALAEVLPSALAERDDEGPTVRARAALRLVVPRTDGAAGIVCEGVPLDEGAVLTATLSSAIAAPLLVLAEAEDIELRARALALLVAGPRRGDRGVLQRAMEDPSPRVVRAALAAQGDVDGDIELLLLGALGHPEWSVRRATALAFARSPRTPSRSAVAALIEATDDPYALVRDAVVRALAAHPPLSAEVVAALTAVCAGDVEERVRATAALFAPCD